MTLLLGRVNIDTVTGFYSVLNWTIELFEGPPAQQAKQATI